MLNKEEVNVYISVGGDLERKIETETDQEIHVNRSKTRIQSLGSKQMYINFKQTYSKESISFLGSTGGG